MRPCFIDHKVFAAKNENRDLVPPHGYRDLGTAYSRGDCFDSLSPGSHRRPGRTPAGSSQARRCLRRSATGAHRRGPSPARARDGAAGPRGPESRGAGGRRAGGRAPRRLGRAAGQDASCRDREIRGAAPTRSPPPRSRPCAAHSPTRPGARGAALTCEAPRPGPPRGRDTPLEGPSLPGPERLSPAPPPPLRAHTHTHPEPLTDPGRPDTHPLPVAPRAATRPPKSPLAPPRTGAFLPPHLPGDALLFPTHGSLLGGAKTLDLLPCLGPRRSHSSHFPAAGETHTRARAHRPPPSFSPSRGRRRKHKQPRAGLAPARPEGEPRGRRGLDRARGARGSRGPAPPPHLHSARRGPGGGDGGGGGATGAGAAAAGEAAAAVAAGLRAAKTCRQPAGGERHRPEGTRGGRAGPGRRRNGRGGGEEEGG